MKNEDLHLLFKLSMEAVLNSKPLDPVDVNRRFDIVLHHLKEKFKEFSINNEKNEEILKISDNPVEMVKKRPYTKRSNNALSPS